MKVLALDRSEVKRLLPMSACLEIMAEALMSLARQEALQPLRMVLRLPEARGALGLMPAYLARQQVMGLKALAIFPHHEKREQDSIKAQCCCLMPKPAACWRLWMPAPSPRFARRR